MLHLPRIMLAAPSSGSGKTMITCGILEAFCRRGLNPASFKCGPDYIDPMFHARVIGTPSRNLDTFFTEPEVTRYLFAKTAKNAGISVLEGVMGIYDGLGGISAKASSYDLALVTKTPIVLVVNAHGMSLSVIPLIKGYLDYQKQCMETLFHRSSGTAGSAHSENASRLGEGFIRGVILNQMTKTTYLLLRDEIERQTGIRLYGYVPRLDDAAVESRHLGLVTPGEIADLKVRLGRLGEELEQCLDLDGLISLAQEAEDYEEETPPHECSAAGCAPHEKTLRVGVAREETPPHECSAAGCAPHKKTLRVGVARDEAFCFCYQDNLDLLKQLGAEIVPFSPLCDSKLPEHIGGLILYGGYPELYARQLSENQAMRAAIREKIENGIPYLAECGGFMYLHEQMEDMEGNVWPMCGCIHGSAYRTPKLGRFGYITLSTQCLESEASNELDGSDGRVCPDGLRRTVVDETDGKAGLDELQRTAADETDRPVQWKTGFLRPGETIRAHEFHYFDSTDPGHDYKAVKPTGKRTWDCIHASDHSVAGYPHLYYWSNPEFAARFLECVKACGEPDDRIYRK
ncbi:MAG: cobyrinic acid a,c-diamide synthase [Lachnospiraceae bacterium]|nr:cobyrinic acid a,c-diamide synthase [Lachnospiraceae bacterium]